MPLVNLRITAKLLIISGALGSLILVMAAIGVWKAGTISHDVAASSTANEGVRLASHVYQRSLILAIAPPRRRSRATCSRPRPAPARCPRRSAA